MTKSNEDGSSNAAVWTTFARLVTEIANFVSLNNSLSNYLQQHQADIKGVTQTKNDAFKNIRDTLSANIASMASVQLAAADVTAVNAAITAYQNTIGTTGAAQTHKTEGC